MDLNNKRKKQYLYAWPHSVRYAVVRRYRTGKYGWMDGCEFT